uniref:Putative RNA-dependent RNA polymerase n=1 Tax=Dansoman virus TaxID=1654363 RepID=A0A2Z4QKM8_9VIRU|nr:putative RNA-dependent RNA polymerase [Dansoman virus]
MIWTYPTPGPTTGFFESNARLMMPPLTTANTTVPAVCLDNIVASVTTRVLGVKASPLPWLTMMQRPRLIGSMPDSPPNHPATSANLVKMCEMMGWTCQLVTQFDDALPQDTVQVIHNTSSYSVDCTLAPMAESASYWTPNETRSRVTYLTSHSSCHPTLLDHSLNRQTNWSLSCRDSNRTTHTPQPRNFTVGSKLGHVEPRVTPLRLSVEEWLKSEEMEWYPSCVEPLAWDTWVKRYPVNRREQLRAALQRVQRTGIQRRDALVKNFVKRETTHNFTDPRNISPRTDEFLAVMGPYVSRIEHAAMKCPFLIKGTSIRNRGKRLEPLLGYGAYIEVDYSRFDKTIHRDIITIFEQHLLRKPFSADHHDYYTCLSHLTRTTGVSKYGTKYTVEGTRCSGDAHTSIANGLLNRFLTWFCLRKLPKESWLSFHEGDDGVIGITPRYLEQALYNLEFLGCLGFNVKLKACKNIEEVVFCGRRITFSAEKGVETICDVTRALRKFNITCSQGPLDLLLYAKALSYNYTDGGTPIVGPVSWSVATCLSYCSSKYSHRQLKRALSNVVRERYLLGDGWRPASWRQLMINTREPVSCAANAAVMHCEDIGLDTMQAFREAAEDWTRIGFIPATVPKLILDWVPEGPQVTVYGDVVRNMI